MKLLPLVTWLLTADKAGVSDGLHINLGEAVGSGAMGVKLIALFTLLSLAPALLLTMTCFTRFLIVFAFARQALGVQGAPPAQVLTGMALFMTLFVMGPTFTQIYKEGVQPYMDGKINEQAAFEHAMPPLRNFMLRSTREEDIALFYDSAKEQLPSRVDDVSFRMLVPAFVASELRTGFQMGFLVLVPFLLIDLLVASILMSLGMAMLSPVLVSLPIKVLVFVFADGWSLLIGSLIRSATG